MNNDFVCKQANATKGQKNSTVATEAQNTAATEFTKVYGAK